MAKMVSGCPAGTRCSNIGVTRCRQETECQVDRYIQNCGDIFGIIQGKKAKLSFSNREWQLHDFLNPWTIC